MNNDFDNKKKLHFNKFETEKIFELSKIDPYQAVILYEDYFNTYPDDYSQKTYYISTLITINQFDKAEEEIKKIEFDLNQNHTVSQNDRRINKIVTNLKINKLKLYLYQNREKELLNLYRDNIKDFSFLGAEIKYLINKIAGNDDINNRPNYHYMIRQIIDYQESDFKYHIKKHIARYNENNRDISTVYFNDDFPINEIIEEIKKYIPSDKKMCFGYFENTYIFKYDECGRDNNKLVDYFKVITFNDSSNFITMYPSQNCEKYPSIDLNYMRKEKEEPKVKVLSQIEKFKRRYNR